MKPAIYNFQDRYEGDTSNEVEFTVTQTVSSVTTAVDLTGVTVKMQIRKKSNRDITKEITNISGITVSNAVNGVFKVDAFITDFKASSYVYDIQFTFTNGSVRTYLKGNFNVVNDITK